MKAKKRLKMQDPVYREKYNAKKREYLSRPEVRAKMAEKRRDPVIMAKKAAYLKEYYYRPEVIAKLKERSSGHSHEALVRLDANLEKLGFSDEIIEALIEGGPAVDEKIAWMFKAPEKK
jgi:hypothetical protein